MTCRNNALLATLIAVSTAATCPALADVYYVTYTGTASGTDTNGVFGTAGAILSNAAFRSTYTYDPAQLSSANLSSTSTNIAVYGGSNAYRGVMDPILSETLTINGIAFSAGSSSFGQHQIQGGTASPWISTSADIGSSTSNQLSNNGSLTGPTILSFSASQAFSFAGSGGGGFFAYNGEQINLTDSYVSITDGPPTSPPPSAPVPEPSSLALLGGGAAMFALARGALRAVSRNRKATSGSPDIA